MSIVINDLHVELAGKHILRGVNLEVADGQRVGIIGPSGSGKSMIVRAILGLLPHGAQVSGSIRLFGEELLTCNERMLADIRGSYIGTIFQNPSMSLNPVLTVRQQVSLPLRLHYDLNRSEVQTRVRRVLTQVGLGEAVENKFPSQLSGGQQQRVAIATALITAPKLILADEPTTALDSINQLSVIHLLTRLVDEAGASMLFVTHDFGVLKKSCQYSYVISDGKVVENGYTHDLLEAPTQLLTQQLVHAAQALTLDEGMQGSALQTDCSVQFGQETFDEEHE